MVVDCGVLIGVQDKGNTSNMNKHLKLHGIRIDVPAQKPTRSKPVIDFASSSTDISKYLVSRPLLPSFSSSSSSSSSFSASLVKRGPVSSEQRQRWTLMLLKMAVQMNVSFTQLSGCDALKQFMAEELGWKLPSRWTLSRLLPTYHAHAVSVLRRTLETVDALSITTDSTFLTAQQVPYICITGHWIDRNWKLHSAVLAVFLAEQSETADFISRTLKDTLNTQLLVRKRIHCIVTDEGQNFVAASDMLKNADVVREHFRCACHRLQLVVKRTYLDDECEELRALFNKCSRVVNLFKNGWQSGRRDVLRRHQAAYVKELETERDQLMAQAAHGTRAIDEKKAALEQKLSLLNREVSKENTAAASEDQRVAAVRLESAESSNIPVDPDLIVVGDPVPDDDDDTDLKLDAEHAAAELRVIEAQNAQVVTDAHTVKALVDFIFKKRALVQRAVTRWLTYVNVVERCVVWRTALMGAINEIKSKDSRAARDTNWDEYQISQEDEGVLQMFYTIGRACKQVIEEMQGARHVTLSELLWQHSRLVRVFRMGSENVNMFPVMRAFCTKALDYSAIKFTVNVDKCAMLAAALDPRFKELSFLDTGQRSKCFDALETAFAQIEQERGVADEPASKRSKPNETVFTDFTVDILAHLSPAKPKHLSELETYRKYPEVARERDPLDWWRQQAEQFPLLSELARRYLAIPASSAASERLFSRLKLTCTASRQSMHSDTLCQLLFLQCHQEASQVSL